MIHSYPLYENINLHSYETLFGFYTLGFIQQHCPDLFIIDIRLKNQSWDCTHDLANYDWLDAKIQQGLKKGQPVVLIPEDEHVVFSVNTQLTNILNNYADSPVYWITMLDARAQQTYRDRHQFRIKMLELPWMMLNECLTYYPVANTTTEFKTNNNNYNFFCLISNTRAGLHKINLIRELHQQQLSSHGLITVNSGYPYPEDLLEYCQVNKQELYAVADPDYPPYARQININNTWVSRNVENYLYLDQEYHNIPLAINPETVTVNFKSTEKSIWPVLLGKLFLIYGRPGSMAWIQRFYDVDISCFANTDYDLIDNDAQRLSKMVSDNHHLIKNAHTIQQQLYPELQSARWTLGANLYKFFISQLELIV
jgi:hypothetical protein